MAFRPDRPYNELPSLPPLVDVETRVVPRGRDRATSVRICVSEARLCEIGVLEERKAGRDKLFTNPALLRVLTQTDA